METLSKIQPTEIEQLMKEKLADRNRSLIAYKQLKHK